MNDPHQPGWVPAYTGPDRELGKVGSGKGFGVSLYHLYRAGRTRLPEIAEQYVELVTTVHQTQHPSHALFQVGGRIDQPAHQLWQELRDDLQRVFRTSALHFYATGRALVEIADRYVRTDEEATEEFTRRVRNNADDFADDPMPNPDPPKPSDYAPPAPERRDPGLSGGSTYA